MPMYTHTCGLYLYICTGINIFKVCVWSYDLGINSKPSDLNCTITRVLFKIIKILQHLDMKFVTLE